jgi:arginyl-tRNA synthetase
VEDNLDVFETDERAFVFRAEQFGLHTRVFVNSLGHPTYEAKDLALAFAKNEDYPNIDKSIIMTANEQIDYFRVLLKALEKIDVNLATKTSHLSFGFVNLKEGKMSSRSGNVVNASWLIEEVKNRLKSGFKEVDEGVLDDLSVGAVKWSMLKFSRESDIAFSIDESIDLAGNSGPYMQYTYARIVSLLKKSRTSDFEAISVKNPDPDLLALMRKCLPI